MGRFADSNDGISICGMGVIQPKEVNMKIDVTQNHIDGGKRRAPSECPISLACADKGLYASVTPKWACIDGVDIMLPLTATAFVLAFDRGEPVQPFSFRIEL